MTVGTNVVISVLCGVCRLCQHQHRVRWLRLGGLACATRVPVWADQHESNGGGEGELGSEF